MHLFFTITASFFILLSYGQNFSYPAIRTTGSSLVQFVPPGWVLLDSVTGDLNSDHVNDAAIILQLKDSISLVRLQDEDTIVTKPRILIILLKDSSGGFVKVEQSNSFILTHDNSSMDDPFQKLHINKGILQLDFRLFYHMGSWYTTTGSYKFRYQNKEFVLIGADYYSIHRASLDFENYSYNFLTKRRSLTKGNESKGTKKVSWKTLNMDMPKSLKTFKTPFSWEVEQDIFL